MCVPPDVIPGTATKVILRGWSLKDARLVAASPDGATIEILSHGAAPVPGRQKAEEIGDEQLELQVTVPEDFDHRQLQLTVTTPAGTSQPHRLLTGGDVSVVSEVEPNDGFRQAQAVSFPQIISGTIHADGNVDVYTVKLDQETRIRIRIEAAHLGSNLDSLLTVYSASGNIVASNDDDGDLRDSLVETTLPTGSYHIVLQDAHDRGGPAHPYRLTIRQQP
ncbi:MAG: PPC domain-containing protein [Planctomycetaceae bacterium]|nr:PPC domain-containing protein [Planctomycetaceae bacterium]